MPRVFHCNVAVVLLVLSCAYQSCVYAQSTSSTCTYKSLTKTLNFETTTTYGALPTPYEGLYFDDRVEPVNISLVTYYYGGKGFIPASGAYALSSNQAVGSNIATYNTQFGFNVTSFYFVCLDRYNNPTPCTLELIGVTQDIAPQRIITNTYVFKPSVHMQKVTLNLLAQTLYFATTKGDGMLTGILMIWLLLSGIQSVTGKRWK